MSHHQPFLFKKMNITKRRATKIRCIQSSFESFCLTMIKRCPDNQERQQAIYRMQEACVWFCRSMAFKDFKPTDIAIKEKPKPLAAPVPAEPTPEEIAEQEADQSAWLKANTIAVPENKPVVVVRKKKIPLSK